MSGVKMLTKDEAVDFVEQKLKVEFSEDKFKEKQLDLLNEIIEAFFKVIPFQNITLLCLEKDTRRGPLPTEIKDAMLSTQGGLCFVNNAGFKFILEALGFDVFLIGATVTHPNDHAIIVAIIDNIQYLVDVGCGYPAFNAIPLNFEDESPVYSQSFSTYKLVRNGDSIERLHLRNTERGMIAGNPKYDKQEGAWIRFYDFKIVPVSLSFFEAPMNDVYTVPGTSPFLISLRVTTFENNRCIAIRDTSLLTEGDDRRLHEEKMSSLDEMKAAILKLCPQISIDDVDKALKRWEEDIKPTLSSR